MGRAYAVPKDMAVKIFLDSEKGHEEFDIEAFDHFQSMVDEFAREIQSGTRTIDYEGDLLAQVKILDAGLRSHAKNREVLLSELD